MKRKEVNVGPWQVDDRGRRYRKVGSSIEYATKIMTTAGTVYADDLEAHNESQKLDRERRLKEMQAKEQALQTGKSCFLKMARNTAHSGCRKNCLFYSIDGDRCAFAGGAVERDPIGADCPVVGRKCMQDCAMYIENRCAFMKRKEG